jgi:FdhD protein
MDALLETLDRVKEGIRVTHMILQEIPGSVYQAQELFKDTGATHAAALFDEKGAIFAVREDVGRHNAVDKVIGAALLRGTQTSKMGVFLSGRASLELIVKAARAGISVMVSVSAPTDAAVTMAERLGIALVGFARDQGFTIYTHPERIVFAKADAIVPLLVKDASAFETLLAA